MELITSRTNPQIKQIRKLRERKERESSGLYFIEGIRIVMEAIQIGAPVEKLILCPEMLSSQAARTEVDRYAAETGVPVLEVIPDVFKHLSEKEGPQGLGAMLREKWFPLEEIQLQPHDVWVALDSVADPGNLGTILRTNDAAGGKGIILLDHCTDPFDPGSVRGSMGALFSQKLVRTSFENFSNWVKRAEIPVIGTSDKAKLDAFSVDYPDPVILLMGSERAGLTPAHFAICQKVVSIPMLGRSDSLNLAVATAIVLYQIASSRRNPVSRRRSEP